MTRRFFQIHLLTAVVGMLTVGGVLGLNLVERTEQLAHPMIMQSKDTTLPLTAMMTFNRGWPCVASQAQSFTRLLLRLSKESGKPVNSTVPVVVVPWADLHEGWKKNVQSTSKLGWGPYATWQDVLRDIPEVRASASDAYERMESAHMSRYRGKAEFYWKAAAVNAAAGLAILIVVIAAFEWFLRRRETVKK